MDNSTIGHQPATSRSASSPLRLVQSRTIIQSWISEFSGERNIPRFAYSFQRSDSRLRKYTINQIVISAQFIVTTNDCRPTIRTRLFNLRETPFCAWCRKHMDSRQWLDSGRKGWGGISYPRPVSRLYFIEIFPLDFSLWNRAYEYINEKQIANWQADEPTARPINLVAYRIQKLRKIFEFIHIFFAI